MIFLNDFNTSVERALEEIEPNYKKLPGLVVCGTHSPHDTGQVIRAIRDARVTGTPFLGICAGHQLAAIEYARNVLGITRATSEEFAEKGDFIVAKNPDGLHVGQRDDGETYWNNYHVVGGYGSLWQPPKHMISVQYHPEYQSSKGKPHPVLVKFIELCKR